MCRGLATQGVGEYERSNRRLLPRFPHAPKVPAPPSPIHVEALLRALKSGRTDSRGQPDPLSDQCHEPMNDAKSSPAFGFLTVVDDPRDGLFGGYLVLNAAGRPLEFHCTAPIKPNRAQQILYGPTLEPYLFGEQIGQALLVKARIVPWLVCTDREPALAARAFVDVPMVLVLGCDTPNDTCSAPGAEVAAASESSAETDGLSASVSPSTESGQGTAFRLDPPHSGPGGPLIAFTLGRNRLAVPGAGTDDPRLIADRLSRLSDGFDLAEPFQRIREAIEEARRGVQ